MKYSRRIRFSDERDCSFDEMIRATQKAVQVVKVALPLWKELIDAPDVKGLIRTRLRCYPAIRFLTRRMGLMLRLAPSVIAIYRDANKNGYLPTDPRTQKTLGLMSNLYIFQQLDTVFRLLFHTNDERLKEVVEKFRKAIEPFSRGVYRKTPLQFSKDAGQSWL